MLYGIPLPKNSVTVIQQTAGAADQARSWLGTALSGALDRSHMTASARKSITADFVAELVSLGNRLGVPEHMDLTAIEPGPSTTTFVYRVTFAGDVLEFDLGLTGANMLDSISVSPWYDYYCGLAT